MKHRVRSYLLSGLLFLAFLSLRTSHASAQSVIVYGNGGYGNAAASGMRVNPQPNRQYLRQQSLSQNGYSVVVPQSRVKAYDRVTPQPYRGAGQRAPAITYSTQQDGFYYGEVPSYGYGLSFGAQPSSNSVAPGAWRANSRNRIFFSR